MNRRTSPAGAMKDGSRLRACFDGEAQRRQLTQDLLGPTGRVIALDPSPGMLAKLGQKVSVEVIHASAEAMPLLARLTGRQADVRRLWAYHGDTIEAAIDPEPSCGPCASGFTQVACAVSLGVFRDDTGVKPA